VSRPCEHGHDRGSDDLKELIFGSKVRVIIISTLIISLLFFGIANIVWFRYTNSFFAPFLENDKLVYESTGTNWALYSYRDQETGYITQVSVPPYLRSGGIVSVTKVDTMPGDFYGGFKIFSNMLNLQRVYVLNLGEEEDTGDPYARSSYSLGSAVDINGRPLGRHPDDSEEFYEQWLSLYDKHYDEAMGIIRYMRDFFGEDLFW